MVAKPKRPKKKRLKLFADRLWSHAVKDDWNNRCAICNKDYALHSHHLVPRMYHATRFNVRNGICLCFYCHTNHPRYSPHQNVAGFDDWLKERHPGAHAWMHEHKHPQDDITKTDLWYVEKIQELRNEVDPIEFAAIVGPHFVDYLDSLDATE